MARLAARSLAPEVMDDPTLDPARHRTALAALARINRLSRSPAILWPALAHLARSLDRPPRVLDVACGGGDVTIGLWRKARQRRIAIQLAGCDISPTALEVARRQATIAEADIEFFAANVLREPFPEGFDAIVCSLFLHHLTEADAETFLRRAGQAAGRLVLVNDLARGWIGLALAAVVSRLLTRSDVVHTDAVLSVRAAFTPSEAVALAERAGLGGATAHRRWPCRFLLSWHRPATDWSQG